MSNKPNVTCGICGKQYYACGSCQEVKQYKPWRMVCDTLPHYAIYLAIADYTNTKNKAKAKDALSKCDLSDIGSFTDTIRNIINEIMSDDLVNKVEVKKIEEVKKKEVKKTETEKVEVKAKEPIVEKENENNETKEVEEKPVKIRAKSRTRSYNRRKTVRKDGDTNENNNE